MTNFPQQSNAVELLYLQHILKSVKTGGKICIVVRESILINSNKAFFNVRNSMLEDFNLHTIISLPSGVFLPYSGVKTNVLFLEKTGSTQQIWYYKLNPPYKLTKNKPIQYDHFKEFLALLPTKAGNENAWTVKATDIQHFDISAKNPIKQNQVALKSTLELKDLIRAKTDRINDLVNEVFAVLEG